MSRAKHADLIIAWANGAALESNDLGEWRELIEPNYTFKPDCEYRIKPKEPEWWENMAEHGVLCWIGSDVEDLMRKQRMTKIIGVKAMKDSPSGLLYETIRGIGNAYATPLTNEEIERFKR